MLDAWGDHPVVEATLEEASDALGQDLGKLIHEGPKEDLALTTNTQPVMLVAAIAAYRVWQAEGGATPTLVAGHSLGEYSALVASGALSLSQAVPLVRFRAQAMQEAVAVGSATPTTFTVCSNSIAAAPKPPVTLPSRPSSPVGHGAKAISGCSSVSPTCSASASPRP